MSLLRECRDQRQQCDTTECCEDILAHDAHLRCEADRRDSIALRAPSGGYLKPEDRTQAPLFAVQRGLARSPR